MRLCALGKELPQQSDHDSRDDCAISSIQRKLSKHAWLLLCSRCHGQPCQILPVKEHPAWEAFPPHTGAGGKGREREWQELIYLSQASVSLSTTHSSSITAGSYGDNGLCGSESVSVTAGRIPQTEPGCKNRHREDGQRQQRCFDLCSQSRAQEVKWQPLGSKGISFPRAIFAKSISTARKNVPAGCRYHLHPITHNKLVDLHTIQTPIEEGGAMAPGSIAIHHSTIKQVKDNHRDIY